MIIAQPQGVKTPSGDACDAKKKERMRRCKNARQCVCGLSVRHRPPAAPPAGGRKQSGNQAVAGRRCDGYALALTYPATLPDLRVAQSIEENEVTATIEATQPRTTSPSVNPNKALWEKGDFTRIASTMRESGEALVRAIGVKPGERVLDLGSGDGTTALPAAQLGADVLAVDIAANLVRAGQARARQAGLANLSFQEGDASALDALEDASFDLSVSIFGAMFAPRPFDVARELVRVTRRGGRIVMGNWIPGDPTLVAQILRISAAYTPPPPAGFVSPMTWGVEGDVLERFAAAGIPAAQVAFSRDTFTFRHPGTPAAFVEAFRDYYGPTMNAYDAAAKNGKAEALHQELVDLFSRQNQSGRADATVIPATFLRVTVSR
ncbi:MAG TPA: class I SAM-dependent methyltransferase [Burkholderiales bacterium]|nr:class I SAM-dependent methyltransferase [Burkholderiales bacterium]